MVNINIICSNICKCVCFSKLTPLPIHKNTITNTVTDTQFKLRCRLLDLYTCICVVVTYELDIAQVTIKLLLLYLYYIWRIAIIQRVFVIHAPQRHVRRLFFRRNTEAGDTCNASVVRITRFLHPLLRMN